MCVIIVAEPVYKYREYEPHGEVIIASYVVNTVVVESVEEAVSSFVDEEYVVVS